MSNHTATPRSAISVRISPEIKLTPFSAFNPRNSPKVSANTGVKMISPPAFVLHGMISKGSLANSGLSADSLNTQDPFVSSSTKAKLSPTANNFTPLGNLHDVSTSLSTLQDESAPTPGQSVPGSSLEASAHRVQSKNHMAALALDLVESPISHTCMESLTNSPFQLEDDCTRYLMIGNVFKSLTHEEIEAAFSCQGFSLPSFIVTIDLGCYGVIYASFNDIREASKAHLKLRETQPGWTVHYIQIEQYMSKYSPGSQIDLAEYKGEVYVTVTYYGSRQRYDAGGITYMVKKLLRSEGEIMSCDVIVSTYPHISFFAKYFDVVAAKMAILRLNGSQFTSCTMLVSHVPVALTTADTTRTRHLGPLIIGHEDISLEQSLNKLDLTPIKRPSLKYFDLGTPPVPGLSPTLSSTPGSQGFGETSSFERSFKKDVNQIFQTPPRSTSSYYTVGGSTGPTIYHTVTPRFASHDGKFTHLMQLPSHQAISPLSKLNLRQHSDCLSGHHNIVDVERIRLGLDVRTTIMLRNIPNKIDQAMLKEIVDETSFGKYDFMYLRIDFANNCNVGYAFINFEDPWQIIDFVNVRAGHRWNRFNSDKVAEVSYATIQGKDCLVQKFRNSSVMLEHPSFRPKIFHTNGSVLAGQEDNFPSPDNPSKMRRSVENAEHVGLFAPRAGQHFRNQQRRRRSQYDRGTRLAEFEDAYEVEDFANSLVYGYGTRIFNVGHGHDYVCDPTNTYRYTL